MSAITVFQNPGALMVKNLRPGMTEVGKIKIGMKNPERRLKRGRDGKGGDDDYYQRPEKIDHFRITTLERGPDGNFVMDAELHKRFGERPTTIPVRLLFNDPWLSFQTRYIAMQGGRQICTGDGENAQEVQRDGTLRHKTCPCERLDPAHKGTDKCKINGTLSVVIDGAEIVGGVWKLRTTSINTCQGIASSLALLTSVARGQLAGLPLWLTVRPKAAITPDGQATTIYVVGLEYRGSMEQLQGLALQKAQAEAIFGARMEAVEQQARLMLAAPTIDAAEEREIAEEFYPEQFEDRDGQPPQAPARPPQTARSKLAAELLGQADEPEPPAPESDGDEEFDRETGEIPEPEPAKAASNGHRRTIPLYYNGREIEAHAAAGTWLTALVSAWTNDRAGTACWENLDLINRYLPKVTDPEQKGRLEDIAANMREDLEAEAA